MFYYKKLQIYLIFLVFLLKLQKEGNMIYKFLAIFLGGGIGAVARFSITSFFIKVLNMPYLGTFSANLIGCFLIGYICAIFYLKAQILPQNLKLFLTVGFLGGLTTFSTFNYEIFSFIKDEKILHGLIYMFLSCFLGLALTFLGFYLANIQFKS